MDCDSELSVLYTDLGTSHLFQDLTIPTFPYFFVVLLLFHENALLSLLFHSKLSFAHETQ